MMADTETDFGEMDDMNSLMGAFPNVGAFPPVIPVF